MTRCGNWREERDYNQAGAPEVGLPDSAATACTKRKKGSVRNSCIETVRLVLRDLMDSSYSERPRSLAVLRVPTNTEDQ